MQVLVRTSLLCLGRHLCRPSTAETPCDGWGCKGDAFGPALCASIGLDDYKTFHDGQMINRDY